MTKLLACLLLLSGLSFGQALNTLKGVPLGGAGSSVPSACTGQGTMFFKTAATRGWYWCNGGSYTAFGTGTGSGTVTSVGFTGGLISVGTPTSTPAFTVAGTSGGIPYFASASTWASSGLLAANQLVLGGGAATTPATLGSLGTTTTVLHGNAAGAPTFGAIVAADITNATITGTQLAASLALTTPNIGVASGTSLTATGALSGATYLTATNCAGVGTAANPSVASCSAAASGAFSCATNSSAGTCTVNTTAVTANSRIFVQESAAEGSNLSVTCNTAPTVVPAVLLASKSAATSFTINSPTFTVNPVCFVYWIVN